jgi:Lactonase, 7-bladed beta-propeller
VRELKGERGSRIKRLAVGAGAALLLSLTAAVALAVRGSLTFVEQHRDGLTAEGLDGATHLAVSPDGKHVYAASSVDDSVVVLSRSTGTGALSFVQQLKDGVGGVDGLDGAAGIAVSPDGKHVYATGEEEDAIAAFAREPTTGALSFIAFLQDGAGGVDGLDQAFGVATSPDGANVYATGIGDDAIATFARDPTTGVLTFLEQEKDGVDGVDGLGGAVDVDVACDGRAVYETAGEDDAVAAFAREGGVPGTCAPNLELDAAKQRLRRYVRGTATCGPEACTVEVEGKLKGAGGGLRLKPDTAELAFDEEGAVALKLGRRVRRKAKEARREGRKVLAKLTATAEDLAGNEAEPEKIKIKLK